jgi:hypothetical protein
MTQPARHKGQYPVQPDRKRKSKARIGSALRAFEAPKAVVLKQIHQSTAQDISSRLGADVLGAEVIGRPFLSCCKRVGTRAGCSSMPAS